MDRGALQLHEQIRNGPHHAPWASGVESRGQPRKGGAVRMVVTLLCIAFAGTLAFPVLGIPVAAILGLIVVTLPQIPLMLIFYPFVVAAAFHLYGVAFLLFGILLAATLVPAAMLGWTGRLHRVGLGLVLAAAMAPIMVAMTSYAGTEPWRMAVVTVAASLGTALLFRRNWLAQRLYTGQPVA